MYTRDRKTPFLLQVRVAILVGLYGLTACDDGGLSCGLNSNGDVVECVRDAEGEETNSQLGNRYCVVRGLCDPATAAQVCAYNQEGLINQATLDKWSGSSYLAGVECKNLTPPEITMGADPGDVKHGLWPAGFCGDQNDSATSGATSATSGGSSSSSGGETTGEEDNIWLCSLNSYDNCANVDPDHGLVGAGFFDEYPGDSTRDACWHSTQKIGDNKFPSLCVEAETEEGARVQCEKDCLQQKANFLEACNNDIACNYIVANLDCDLTGADKPWRLSEQSGSWACLSPLLMLSAWQGSTSSVPATLSGTFTSPNGVTVPLLNIPSYTGYSLSNCDAETCDISIDVLEGLGYSKNGSYMDAAGGTGPYTLDWGDFSMRDPLVGTWNITRESITFDNDLLVALTSPSVAVDGTSYTPGYQTIQTNQVVGNLDELGGTLSVNATFAGTFGTLTISVVSVE